ncbi:50S ribosomal protein L13 [Candidatus Gottesmanbacteria bacterium]|nr:50S ribosomal protein L13 [Candidatus Gottesmanbacteria bacterium]
MNSETKPTKISTIVRKWHMIDVQGKVLGRIATEIAHALMGKAKPYFVRHLDCGDYIVVTNAAHIVVTGEKEKTKLYGRYSGFPSGLKQKPFWKVRAEKPTEIIRHAVMGMLPKNKLRDRMNTRLYVYPESEHPYGGKFETIQK